MPTTYIPPHARVDDHAELESFVRAHPFATLISAANSEVSVSHLPLMFETSADGGHTLRGHVARANPHWRAFETGATALAIFHGPQAYVTPQWYPSKVEHAKVVPTWNYAVVHVAGQVRTITDATWLHAHVSALTKAHESTFAHQWAVSDAPSDYIDKMLAAIVGLEMTVTSIDGKWKLSGNRSAPDREGAINGLASRPDPASQAVSQLMRRAQG